MTSCPWPVGRLLPHAAPMLLLDEVAAVDDARAVAVALMRPDHPFAAPEGVPAHVGLELMAQTCGAWVGARALAAGEPVRLGFLLGTRHYQSRVTWFAPGQRLEITACVVLVDLGVGVFDCAIARDGEPLATARLSLYQPQQHEEMAR